MKIEIDVSLDLMKTLVKKELLRRALVSHGMDDENADDKIRKIVIDAIENKKSTGKRGTK